MKTDNELTVLIAEKVMGWELGQGPWYTRQGEPMFVVNAFRPLVNDSPAFMVVDKMIEDGWNFDMENMRLRDGITWVATFARGCNEEQHYKDYHDLSRRRAICLAALRAVGVEVE